MNKARVLISIIFVIVLMVGGLVISAGRIAILITKHAIESYLPGSSVSVGAVRLDPRKEITLSDVHIKIPKFLDMGVNDIMVRYSIPGILTGSVEFIGIDGASISVDLTNGMPPELKKSSASVSSGPLRIHNISISGTSISIAGVDLSMNGTLDLRLLPLQNKIDDISLTIESFKIKSLIVEAARLKGPISGAGAIASIKSVKLGDAVLGDIRGLAILNNSLFSIDISDCRIFDGNVTGRAEITMSPEPDYSMEMAFKAMDLDRFIRDYKLEEKIVLSGRANGEISLKGSGAIITDLKGSFFVEAPGGTMILKDSSMLDSIAKSSKEQVDILMEGLKNYRYTIGTMKMGLDGANIALDVAMDGETGKRAFYVVLHELIKKKGGAQ